MHFITWCTWCHCKLWDIAFLETLWGFLLLLQIRAPRKDAAASVCKEEGLKERAWCPSAATQYRASSSELPSASQLGLHASPWLQHLITKYRLGQGHPSIRVNQSLFKTGEGGKKKKKPPNNFCLIFKKLERTSVEGQGNTMISNHKHCKLHIQTTGTSASCICIFWIPLYDNLCRRESKAGCGHRRGAQAQLLALLTVQPSK